MFSWEEARPMSWRPSRVSAAARSHTEGKPDYMQLYAFETLALSLVLEYMLHYHTNRHKNCMTPYIIESKIDVS